MNTSHITAMLAITALSFSAGALAENLSHSEYRAAEKQISVEYNSAKKSCDSFTRSARNLCMAEAKRTEKAAKTKLAAGYRPSGKAPYEISVTKA